MNIYILMFQNWRVTRGHTLFFGHLTPQLWGNQLHESVSPVSIKLIFPKLRQFSICIKRCRAVRQLLCSMLAGRQDGPGVLAPLRKSYRQGMLGSLSKATLFPPLRVWGTLPSLWSCCVGHFRCIIILRSTLQSWFHYPHFIKEGSQTPINNFLMVTHTISGRVGVRLKLQSWDSKACVLSIPVCVREEGKFLKSYFGKIEWVGKQKKPKSFKSRFLYF